ncbi:MAG: phosphatidate cytidylyltransferase [Candidatus Nanopelagicales bacterium]|nr:phosphatidate cytidylyltransferase [Candidatus Nanopelagicales bacterium]
MSKIKTGRNLPLATLIGLLLITLVIASLFIYKYVFIILALIALLLGAREFTNQWSKTKNVPISFLLVSLSIIAMTISAALSGINGLLISYLIAILLNAFYSLFKSKKVDFSKIFWVTTFVISYLGIFGSLAMLMLRVEDGASRVFLFIAITALSDTGGYLTGIVLGKHRLAPNISPNKSYEGLIGSIIFASLFAGIIGPEFLDITSVQGVIIGIVLAFSGTLGDLFESGIKRKLGIKDFSTLIPGHGGMFDRLDSLAPNALLSFLLFGYFLGFS